MGLLTTRLIYKNVTFQYTTTNQLEYEKEQNHGIYNDSKIDKKLGINETNMYNKVTEKRGGTTEEYRKAVIK